MSHKNFCLRVGTTLLVLVIIPAMFGCGSQADQRATPTPSDPLARIAEEVALVPFGQGIPETRAYVPESNLPNKLILITLSGELHPANKHLPSEVQPSTIQDLSLVGVVSEEQEYFLEKCDYIGGPPIERFFLWKYVRLYEAQSGRFVGSVRIYGPDPEKCLQQEIVSKVRLVGEPISDEELANTLSCYLTTPQNCPIPNHYIHTDGKVIYQDDSGIVDIWQVAVSPDGQSIAAASDTWNAVNLMQIADGTLLQRLAHTKATLVSYSPNGQIVATGGRDSIMRLWQASNGRMLHALHLSGWATALAFSPDGEMIASASLGDSSITLWAVDSGSEVQSIQMDYRYLNNVWESITISPDGGLLALGGDWFVPIINISDGTESQTLMGHGDRTTSVMFSPDGKLLASGSYDGTVRIWDVTTGETIHIFGGLSEEELQKLMDEHNLDFTPMPAPVVSVVYSPDGSLVAATKNFLIEIWDIANSALVGVLIGHNHYVSSISFSADGNTIVSSANDGTIRSWDMTNIYQIISP